MATLKRGLGLFSLTFYGVGMILGAGIYSVIGAAAGDAGDSLWLSFLLSSVVVLLTALAYAELSTMFPEAGAEFIYLREAFPKASLLAFVTSAFVALSGAATAATVSIAFAGYLGHFVDVSPALTALVVLAAATGVAIVGIKESSGVNIVFTLIEVSGLLIFIFVGVQSPAFGEALWRTPGAGVASAAALVFFSFLGFENIANLAEETKNPGVTLPRAILLSVAISTTIYLLVGISAVSLLAPEKLAASASPLATALAAHAPKLAGALGGIALFATANTALISMIATSRILMSIARKKDLPAVFAKTHPTRKTPWAATLLAFGVSALLLPLGKVEIVASVSSISSLLAFISVNVALVALRLKRPGSKRPFRVPLAIGRVPVIPILSVLFLTAFLTQFDPPVYVIAGSALLALGLFHFGWRRLVR